MLDSKKIKEDPLYIKEILDKRGISNPWKDSGNGLDLAGFQNLMQKHRETLARIEELRTRRNKISDEFAKLKKEKKETDTLSAEIDSIKKELSASEKNFDEIEQKFSDALLRVPNALDPSVPQGKGAEDNKEVRIWGKTLEFPFTARAHWEIGEKLGILDFAAAGKISGSRFAVLKGAGAALERALISFMLDLHIREHGYTEVFPPYLVNKKSMEGTGQLPKFEEEMFKVGKDDLYLIPTAEVSVTNLHRDEVLDAAELPKKLVCYSACFRREAGSYGKDTKGLIRNHQFNKVELVWFTKPETSFQDLEMLTGDAEDVLKKLDIPYRVVALCSGDMGFASAKTYDLEVWMPGEKKWREISSCSCFTDFQAIRMNIKFKAQSGKREFAHTLNGSGVAAGRLFAAVLENYQQQDGSVTVPEALKPYLKMDRIRV